MKLLSICPHCVRTIGTDWQEAGATFAIEHHTELLARFADRLPAARREEGRGGVPRPLLPGALPRMFTISPAKYCDVTTEVMEARAYPR